MTPVSSLIWLILPVTSSASGPKALSLEETNLEKDTQQVTKNYGRLKEEEEAK